MKNLPRFLYQSLFGIGVCAFFFFCSATAAQAQAIDPFRYPEFTSDPRYYEWQMKLLKQNTKPKTKPLPIAWQRIREDYKQIQIAGNELREARAASGATATPDYKWLREKVEEIRERAVRLQENLPLPELDEPVSLSNNELSLETRFNSLDGLIVRFVKNPMFKETEVLDVNAGTRAGRDLALVVLTCKNIESRLKELAAGKNNRK